MNAFKRWLMKQIQKPGDRGSNAVPMPSQNLAFIPRRGDNYVRIDVDNVVYIRSGPSMPWRELEQAKKELG